MRLTSDFWVSALTRRVFDRGGFAAVLRRGATEAGAIFLIVRERTGTVTLFGPAPQTSYDDTKPQERVFTQVLSTDDEGLVADRIARESRFDPDLWLVELETDIDVEDLISLTKP